MTTATMNQFFAALEKSGLLSPAAFDEARKCAEVDDGAGVPLAKRLVDARLLTPFQAKQILSGRHRGFFIADKYKILEVLGEGGMGRVLLCEHMLLRRLVAVKLMHADAFTKSTSAVDRFLREARAAASLNHLNIAQVFDVDQSERGPYLVMEFVDGIDFHRYVAKYGALEPARAANLIGQAAAGLQHAHAAGLVHRDIKPVNLMLDRSGTVKLLDLGLARFYDAEKDDKLTQQHDMSAVIGTADFIAPEQVMESSSADIRADIYSLGLSLYFVLTKQLPFGPGKAIQKLVWHQTREPESVRTVRPEVPEEFAAVLQRMIKKDPAERYQTPAEVCAALAPFAVGAIAAPQPGELPQAWWTNYRLGLTTVKSKPVTVAETVTRSTVGGASGLSRLSGDAPVGDTRAPQHGVTAAPGSQSDVRPLGGSASPAVAQVTRPAASPARVQRQPQVKQAAPSIVDDWLSGEFDTGPSPLAAPLPPLKAPSARISVDRRIWIGSAIALGMAALLTGGTYWATRDAGNLPPIDMRGASRDAADPGPQQSPEITPPPTQGIALHGGGSTFVQPMLHHWSQLYQQQSTTHVEYTAVGSSKGIEGVTLKLLDFGCTDAYMNDEQLKAAGGKILHLPLVLGAVVPTYNVPLGTGAATPLRFTGPVLANIFLGRITHWNDPSIVVNNPGVTLPDLPITVVYRKDGSGTSSIWTDYLSKTSATWKEQVGAGTKVTWPVGVGAEKNDGVADAVSRTTGAIGYVELSFALANGQPFGQVKNREGAFITPSIDSVTAAAAGALNEIPPDLRYSLTDAPGPASYPIVGTTWAVIFVDQPSAKRTELLKFLRWATGEGQAHAGALKYAPLPKELAARVQVSLNEVDGGK